MAKKFHEVGIKQLKDDASALVDQVARTRRPVIVCRGKHRIARLVPYEADDIAELLLSTGLVSKPATESWNTLKLEGAPSKSSSALEALLREREESR